jgi:site-specific recombinase XerD
VTSLAPTLQAFFVQRLGAQRNASPHTIAAYRDTFRLLLRFVKDTKGVSPAKLSLEDLDATLVAAFLDDLEHRRGVSVRTRNSRLAAIHSFYGFAAMGHSEHAGLIQRVLAIPPKRARRTLISYLTTQEITALLAAPNLTTRIGSRDRAILLVAIRTGLRVSELASLRRADVTFGPSATVSCIGKCRKHRTTPIDASTARVVHAWLAEMVGDPGDPLFAGPRGEPLSRDAVSRIVSRHAKAAVKSCPTLGAKRVTPHLLRHTCAMQLLAAGVDVAVIALWLGHESIRTTDIYQHADLALKERALSKAASPVTTWTRFRPPDKLLAFLEAL